ncbi:MAG: helix-turn-helix domain-containing protein [Cyclobacteriaceae bacterium]|nr:helix-turn-helix domain-containing protein [Cyclobacteriaceae bacterium]
MTQLILTTRDELRSLLREEFDLQNSKQEVTSNDETLLKRTEVAKLFGVSLVTVHAWMYTGKIPFHRIGNRVFFKKGELFDSMSKVKIRKK